ncbi:putative efflux protein, MATE family [Rhizobium sp. RU20A]|uniref:MATE family efflux transporter n=1 Tax=Rhizobium sp. RU20A TaxID=1907412 RepID=UPI00095681A4|nr:MATE family efflux transporter [Rhizobium sp. RU20A]SIQ60823.1 putative efflux protein, MATE family [Rhizobium sp. RU20A]
MVASERADEAGPFEVTDRLIFSIAVPMTLAFLTTPLLGLVDTAVVGRLGSAALIAGLAVGAVLFDLLFSTFNFLRAATTGLVAQALGAGDRRAEQATFWRALVSALCLGTVMLALSPLLLAAGLWLMAPEPAVAEATRDYFGWRILSAPLALANYAILGYVLGRGQAGLGLFLQILINGINIVGSIGLGLVAGWGVAGVAAGTVAGETVGALVGFLLVIRRFDRSFAPSVADLLDRKRLAELFALNRDIMIRSFVLLATFTLMTRIGAGMGALTLAANAVLMTLFMVVGFGLDGFANAAEQIVGRAVGARFRPAFDAALKRIALWSFGLAVVMGALFLVFGSALIDLLTTVADVRAEAHTYLPWVALTAVTGALAFLMDGVFIGATWSRDMRNMMLLSFLVFAGSALALVPVLGNHGLWAALNLFLLMRGVLLIARVPARSAESF